MDLASMVTAARDVARKHVVGLEVRLAEKARLPECVLNVISSLPRKTQRYRSAYLDYPLSKPVLVQQEMPEVVEGFHRVMRMIAALAGPGRHPSDPTLYRWEKDLRAMLDEMPGTLRPSKLRPQGIYARHKRRPATPPASFPVCDVPSARLPYTNLTRTPIGLECWGEDWDAEWILVTASRKYAKHLRAVGGRWNQEQLGWFVERQRIWPLIDALLPVAPSLLTKGAGEANLSDLTSKSPAIENAESSRSRSGRVGSMSKIGRPSNSLRSSIASIALSG
jgi:hypothetical protein